MNNNLQEIELTVHGLKYSVVQKLYTQICLCLSGNQWNLIRSGDYWIDKDEASTEFERRKVTLIYFALNKDKLDYDTLYKIHNDYEEFYILKEYAKI
jgi:hypothetical protein